MRRVAVHYERDSATAQWSIRLALFSAALTVAGVVLHRLFSMPTPFALNVFTLGFLLAALAIVLGLLALAFIWRTGSTGFPSAIGGLFFAGLVLGWPLSFLPTVLTEPAINDITTDPNNPPELSQAARLRPAGSQSTVYPGPKASRIQAQLYPDLQPLIVERPVEETMELVASALRRSRLEIVGETEPDRNQTARIEAVATTPVIGFRDDIAIRIVGRGGLSRIDIRSASRWGRHDFGRNAARVRDLVRAILQRLQSTVPGAVQRQKS